MTQAKADELRALADEVANYAGGADNELDVKIEVALFQPCGEWLSARANAAGTKVIYKHSSGRQDTCWADDWTMDRKGTIAALRARAEIEEK